MVTLHSALGEGWGERKKEEGGIMLTSENVGYFSVQ